MRFGPDTYDLASLLRDRGVASLLGGAEEALLGRYAEALGGDPREVRRRYFESLLQRSVKILGTFAKMPIVRGRMHYLEFIPSAVESVRRCLDELPEMAPLASMLPLEVDMGVLRAAAAREHALQA